MGIWDRLRGKEHPQNGLTERARIAHDEAADEFSPEVEETRQQVQRQADEKVRRQTEEDTRQAQDMTAEGDPWD